MVATQAKLYDTASHEDGSIEQSPDSATETRRQPFIFSELAFGLFGGVLGFLIRIVSLNARSVVMASESSVFFYALSQADLAIHGLIWVSFFAIIFICSTSERKKLLTSTVLSLMIGVISGSFIAWNFVDMTLGFPLPLASRLLSFNLMLAQCWLLYRCGDVWDDDDEDDKEMKQPLSPTDNDILIIV